MNCLLRSKLQLKENKQKCLCHRGKKMEQQINFIDKIKELLTVKYKEITTVKRWWDIPVFKRKNNKYRIVLRIENEYMKRSMQDEKLKTSIIEGGLIPIVMFNKSDYWIEWVSVVQIVDNTHIGISFIYNRLDNTIEISGIHVDLRSLFEQHHLASVHKNIDECTCFDNRTSSAITDVEICSTLNSVNQHSMQNEVTSTNETSPLSGSHSSENSIYSFSLEANSDFTSISSISSVVENNAEKTS
eukprot:452178_1